MEHTKTSNLSKEVKKNIYIYKEEKKKEEEAIMLR